MYQVNIAPVNADARVLFFENAPNARKIVKALNSCIANLKREVAQSVAEASEIATTVFELDRLVEVASYYVGKPEVRSAGTLIGRIFVTEHPVF